MTGIETNKSSLRLFAKGSDFANGEVVIDLAALSRALRIIDDAGNIVGHARLDAAVPKPPPTPPKPPTLEQLALADARALECEICPFNMGVKRKVNSFDVHAVKCDLCGCGGLSLIHGKCPKNLWPVTLPPEDSARA